MSGSQRLRLRDVRGVFHLIGEVRELRRNAAAAQEHLVVGACELLGARQGAAMHWRGFSPKGRIKLLGFAAGGWACPEAAELWAGLMRNENWRVDPTLDGATRTPGDVVTRLREELVEDREWYGLKNGDFHEMVRMGEVDHHVVAWYRLGTPDDQVRGIAIHRACADGRFAMRERNILRLLNAELYRLDRAGKLYPGPPGAAVGAGAAERPPLSPRQKQVLDRLLVGDSVKQVAIRLGLSRRTVEDYVKELYRRFGVHSRGELLAVFVGGAGGGGR